MALLRLIFTVLLVAAGYLASAQCTCTQQFSFVRDQIEHNYAGFADKVKLFGPDKYKKATARAEDAAKRKPRPQYCIAVISEWLSFFKDGHVQLTRGTDSGNDSNAMKERIANCEVVDISPSTLKSLVNAKGIEGIYAHSDSAYVIAVIRNRNEFRDYVGVILSSKTDLWKYGQVKLEMKTENDTLYKTLLYFRDHSPGLQHYSFTGHSMNGKEWLKAGTGHAAVSAVDDFPESPINARKLSDSTFYLQVLTFHASYASLIDSMITAFSGELTSMPNLVIDIRNNGGGADFAYRPLLPYIYTGPVSSIGVDVWATADNISSWKSMVLDNPDIPEETKTDVRPLIDSMKMHLGQFITASEDDTFSLKNASFYPRRVAILINNECASSAEQFLLVARGCKRVKLLGQHTAGVLDYANVRSIPSPCREVAVRYATTRSRRVDKGQAIDNIGIQPDIVLPDNKGLVEEARKYLER